MISIKEKVKKLLALSSSSNKHEAEIALKKALSLLYANDIKMDQLREPVFVSEVVYTVKTRAPLYIWPVIEVVENHFNCYCRRKHHAYKNHEFIIDGTRENVDIAVYVFKYLCHTFEHIALKNKKGNSKSFYNGLSDGLCETLEKHKNDIIRKQEEVVRGNNKNGIKSEMIPFSNHRKKIKEFLIQKGERFISNSYSFDDTESSYHSGQEKGRDIRIHPGIRSDTQEIKSIE